MLCLRYIACMLCNRTATTLKLLFSESLARAPQYTLYVCTSHSHKVRVYGAHKVPFTQPLHWPELLSTPYTCAVCTSHSHKAMHSLRVYVDTNAQHTAQQSTGQHSTAQHSTACIAASTSEARTLRARHSQARPLHAFRSTPIRPKHVHSQEAVCP